LQLDQNLYDFYSDVDSFLGTTLVFPKDDLSNAIAGLISYLSVNLEIAKAEKGEQDCLYFA
jgi:hypothetical protein